MTTQTKARAKRDPHAPDPRIAAAVVHRLGEHPYRYEVLSASQGEHDVWHTVTHQPDGSWSCACPAGSHDRICWHTRAVLPAYTRDLERQRDADVRQCARWGWNVPLLSSARYASDLLEMSADEVPVFGSWEAPQ